jgi:hypothetical protein
VSSLSLSCSLALSPPFQPPPPPCVLYIHSSNDVYSLEQSEACAEKRGALHLVHCVCSFHLVHRVCSPPLAPPPHPLLNHSGPDPNRAFLCGAPARARAVRTPNLPDRRLAGVIFRGKRLATPPTVTRVASSCASASTCGLRPCIPPRLWPAAVVVPWACTGALKSRSILATDLRLCEVSVLHFSVPLDVEARCSLFTSLTETCVMPLPSVARAHNSIAGRTRRAASAAVAKAACAEALAVAKRCGTRSSSSSIRRTRKHSQASARGAAPDTCTLQLQYRTAPCGSADTAIMQPLVNCVASSAQITHAGERGTLITALSEIGALLTALSDSSACSVLHVQHEHAHQLGQALGHRCRRLLRRVASDC